MFYDQLKKACDEEGITVTKLCANLGISSANTGRWKSGGTPSVDVLRKMADLLNVSTDYLLGKTDKKNPPADPEEIGFDDFTYAMHNESGQLTEDEKQQLLDLAKIMIQRRKDKESQ